MDGDGIPVDRFGNDAAVFVLALLLLHDALRRQDVYHDVLRLRLYMADFVPGCFYSRELYGYADRSALSDGTVAGDHQGRSRIYPDQKRRLDQQYRQKCRLIC